MPKPPKKCMKCQKMALPGLSYCMSHSPTDSLPRPRGEYSQIRVSDISAGHLAIGKLDPKTGRQWTEHVYSDEWLAKYGRTHG